MKEIMDTELFYFSGTGNSLFVTQELSKKIPDSIITPIISCVSHNTYSTKAKNIGIVFPVHSLTIPIVVKQFLQKIHMVNVEYIFIIATKEGTIFHGFNRIEAILKRKSKLVNSEFVINMHSNDPRNRNFSDPTNEELQVIDMNVMHSIEMISKIVNSKQDYRTQDFKITVPTSNNKIKSWLIEKTVVNGMNVAEYIDGVNYFYHDEKCNGCGICERVCTAQKIKLTNSNPMWLKKKLCFMCYACINFCPKQSIQIHDIPGLKSFTKIRGRYLHSQATVKSIEAQKQG